MYKKLLFSLVTVAMLSVTSKAQISVDSMDMPSVGDTVVMGIDTILPTSIMVGDTGAQTWDFSSLQPDQFETLRYVDPSTTPNATDFPNSNLAIDGVQPIIFQTLDSMMLVTDGYAGDDPFGAGLTVVAPFSPPQTILNLPSTHGSMFTDTSGFDETMSTSALNLPVPDLDSIRLVHDSYVTSVVDAYGNLTIPGSATLNTIRQLYTESTIDSIFIYCSNTADCFVFVATLPFGWSLIPSAVLDLLAPGLTNPLLATTYTYKWWTNGESVPVAEVVADSAGGNALTAKFKLGDKIVTAIGTTTDALCNSDCNGTASVTVMNGTSPFTYSWNTTPVQTNAMATGLCVGTYDIMVIDAAGDTSYAAGAMIAEPTALVLSLSMMPDSGSSQGSATALAGGGTGSPTFAWNTSPVQTAGTATNLTAGIYAVVVTDANGCTITDSIEVTLFVGIDKHGVVLGEVTMYPNPASGEIHIVSTVLDVEFFNIYDISGKLLMNVNIESGSNTMSVSNLMDGMYVYQIVNKSGEVIKNGKFSVLK
ncbi:MAG: hypothetical protein COB85_03070 [Bacteroidetes bacterium]|nr:MAG: hypothetical protein COB85_03070 [Bacteroidota bacterium]